MGYSHGVCRGCNGTGRRVIQREDEPDQRFGDRLFVSEYVECWRCKGRTAPAPEQEREEPVLNPMMQELSLHFARARGRIAS